MANRPLVLYSLAGCASCDAARAFLQRHGFEFAEIDLREEAGAASRLTRLTGAALAPTIVYGDDVQVGWDESRVADMLANPLPAEEEDQVLASIEAAVDAAANAPSPPVAPGDPSDDDEEVIEQRDGWRLPVKPQS